MDRTVRIAIIVACIAVTVAAIGSVVTTVVVTRSLQERPTEESAKTADTTPTDSKEAASGRSKVEEACEEAQLKLLQGEVTDPGERVNLVADVNRYCEERTESPSPRSYRTGRMRPAGYGFPRRRLLGSSLK